MSGDKYVIVVGVDGSESARQALQWAVHEAHGRGGTVKAVTAWRWDFPELAFGDTLSKVRKKAEAMLAHEVDSLPHYKISGIPLAIEVMEGRPANVLVAASHDADLLVLGSHGHSRTLHRVRASVTEDCARNATCPIVVIPVGWATQRQHAEAGRPESLSAQPQRTGDPVHPLAPQATL